MEDVLSLLEVGYCPLEAVSTFALPSKSLAIAEALDLYQEKCLQPNLAMQLESVYKQLYPRKLIAHLSLFYKEYGRVCLAGELIGSVKPGPKFNCQSSSVVSAFWPGSGDSLDDIDYSRMRIGVVQHFIRHSLKVYSDHTKSSVENLEHIFAYVYWKKLHPEASWFGISATVSTDLFEIPGACAYLPVQRIANGCAYATLPIALPSHTESVFVSCPIPLTCNL